jgi:hypothetical protein
MDVERLKKPEWVENDGQWNLILDPTDTPQAMLEAAAEIERLRLALSHLGVAHENVNDRGYWRVTD